VILEDKVELGQEYEVGVGNDDSTGKRRGRVVWVQEESDGMIVGVEFIDSAPPGPPSDLPESNARKRV
jgi:PilZ domain